MVVTEEGKVDGQSPIEPLHQAVILWVQGIDFCFFHRPRQQHTYRKTLILKCLTKKTALPMVTL